MLDVRDMMKDCAVMVEEQGEFLDRIEDDVIDTARHTEKAAGEIMKAETYQRSAQSNMWKLFLMLLLVVAVATLAIVVFYK
jgi:t-SNARE complex subunit (syntaxin)